MCFEGADSSCPLFSPSCRLLLSTNASYDSYSCADNSVLSTLIDRFTELNEILFAQRLRNAMTHRCHDTFSLPFEPLFVAGDDARDDGLCSKDGDLLLEELNCEVVEEFFIRGVLF